MIKKIIACLTICFIITGIISPVFSDASALPQPNWSDPGISEIINISDLTGWMLNGGTFDVSTYTDAESFMNDYFNARTQTRLVSPDEVQEDYYEVLPGFGINNQLVAGESFANPLNTNRVIASSFRDHTGYGRRLSNEVNEALLSSGNLYDTKIPLLNEIEFANFLGYSHNALNLYSNYFVSDSPSPNPDPIFSFITNINNLYGYEKPYLEFLGYGNNGQNWRINVNGRSIIPINSLRDYSWYGDDLSTKHIPNNQYDTLSIQACSLLTINVIENISGVTVSYSNNMSPINNITIWRSDYGASIYGNMIYWISSPSDTTSATFHDGNTLYNRTDFDDLSTAINYIYNHFANVNIYVNGDPWILINDPSNTHSITPEFPDAVGGEDLPYTTWPIFKPRAPYYTNVPGVLQAIEDAIADDGKLDIDDLKPYLTDENGDPVPDPIFDPEPVPIPVPDPVNPDIVPGLPILPAIPPEMPGFYGVTVLAEIINFTNQSLPTALIVTFWGIVFGIVILGLIKILHK